MMQRMKGTLRPGRKAGVLALAVLLLTCVLMAGAVSAEEYYVSMNGNDVVNDGTSGSPFATIQKAVEEAGANDRIIVYEGEYDAFKIDPGKEGLTIEGTVEDNSLKTIIRTLNESSPTWNNGCGGIDISSPSITLKNLSIKSDGYTNGGLWYASPVGHWNENTNDKNGLTIDSCEITNSAADGKGIAIFFVASDITISNTSISGFDYGWYMEGSAGMGDISIIDSSFDVTSSAINYIPYVEPADSSASFTISGTRFISGNVTLWDYANQKIIDTPSINSGIQNVTLSDNTYSENSNIILINFKGDQKEEVTSDTSDKSPVMSYSELKYGLALNPDASKLVINYGSSSEITYTKEEDNFWKGDDGSVCDTNGNPCSAKIGDVCYPTLDAALDAAEDGDTVTLLQDITVEAPITIDEAITFDGSDKKISGSSTEGYFLKVAVPLAENPGESVTLQNLNLSIDSIGSSANLGGITVRANEDNDASVPVTLKDSTVDMSQVTTKSGMNPAVYFVNASGSEIENNVIKAGSTEATGDGVTSRGIVIDGGSDIIVSKNDVTMGTGAIVSIGIQFKDGPTGVTLADNRITATASDNGKLNRAIDITTLGQKDERYTITGTKLLAVGGASFESAVNVIVVSSDPENAELSLTTNGNDFSNVEKGIALVSWADNPNPIKLSGSINEDDFPDLSRENIIALSENLLGKVETTDVVWTHDPEPQPTYSSSSGNMNNAYRVLFNDGSTTLSVQTDLSSGDKLTKPETPVKDGYTFAGWYKDSACTQAWDFETGISGDMTLYAKWTAAGSSGETEATATPTATAVTTPQPTKTQSTTATTSAPQATTAAGVSPTLTQAPAPVAGALFGLLAAGVLLRRRFQ